MVKVSWNWQPHCLLWTKQQTIPTKNENEKYETKNIYTDLLVAIKLHDDTAYLILKKVFESELEIESLPIRPQPKVSIDKRNEWEAYKDVVLLEHKENVISCIEFFKQQNIPLDKLIYKKS